MALHDVLAFNDASFSIFASVENGYFTDAGFGHALDCSTFSPFVVYFVAMGGKPQAAGILKPSQLVRGQTVPVSAPAAHPRRSWGHAVRLDDTTYDELQRIAANTDLKLIAILRIAVQRLAEEGLA